MAKKPAGRKAGVKESPIPAEEAGKPEEAEEQETWTEHPSLEGGPSPGADRSQRVRRVRLAAWVALLMAAVVVGISVLWVTGPPTELELRKRAGLLGKERLKIGVKSDTPNIAKRNGDRVFKGFDIDIAYMIAADLGYPMDKVDLLTIETEDRERMRAKDGENNFVSVDLVVATFSKTPDREKVPSVGFSTPYFETEQSVVTRHDYEGKVDSLEDLKGKKVCTLGTSTSLGKLREAIGGEVFSKKLISDCVTGLKEGDFDAVTTDAALLAGFVAEAPEKLRHHDIALEKSEKWAVNVGPNTALRTLVDLALYRSYADPKDRRWEDAYAEHIKPLLEDNPDIDVAKAEQPCVSPPEVRRWPWERSLPAQDCPSR